MPQMKKLRQIEKKQNEVERQSQSKPKLRALEVDDEVNSVDCTDMTASDDEVYDEDEDSHNLSEPEKSTNLVTLNEEKKDRYLRL